ncbi:MAG TPA: AAA family ATPase [Candidatus Dormibacteraeota bacterium]|nr:AAA family ATPase [Candidatus Dormibacteraeota bacterium]
MRLESVEILGFGRLRDVRVDFAPRVTVLLGENEAGKSTLHRAVRAALYGLDAGSQGRAVERSEWARWTPWKGEQYGLALTYALADGRRFRVARGLGRRAQSVQVVELGGGDVTDQLRVGRAVVPGRVHLGVDEAVFCATACIGEDSLRLDAPDTVTSRADRLQEAVERLADSASQATAAEALARLRAAEARVGTERRGGTPLGQATARLRQVEAELEAARRRTDAVGREQDRLRHLEELAAEAERRQAECERAWLVGRLAAITAQRRELADALEEERRLDEVVAGWSGYAAFPLELEERVIAVAGELAQAQALDRQAAARWSEAEQRLEAIEKRRLEIFTALRALGLAPRVPEAALDEVQRLAGEVAAAGGVEKRAASVQAAQARSAALRQEIAGTGLGAVPVGSAELVADLVETASRPTEVRRLGPVAAMVALVGAGLAAACVAAGRREVGVVAAVLALLAAAAVVAAGRRGHGPAADARRELARRCPGMDLSPAGLHRASRRLGDLRALHADLQRQELLVETGREELEAATAHAADLAQRCLTLAASIPVPVGSDDSPLLQTTAMGLLARARAALNAVEDAASARRRVAELEQEDGRLAREEEGGRAARLEAEERAATRAALEAEMAQYLEVAGLEPDPDPVRAAAHFRQACSTRRQLEATAARLAEVRRRIAVLGADAGVLDRRQAQFAEDLRRRGGDPGHADAAEPLDAAALQRLENTVETARHAAAAARGEAAGLRERLAGLLDGLPAVADLEDERAAALAIRERCLHQLEALRRAGAMIEEAARRVHRDVAPRLAASVGARLALLTESRYDAVDVDAERFAVSLHCAERPELVPLDLVSHGTRDQVSLLLRLALTEVLGDAGEPAPLLLDDPLLTADPTRRRAAVEFLLSLSETNQVVITTTHPGLADQVAREGGGDCSVIVLGRTPLLAARGEGGATVTHLAR